MLKKILFRFFNGFCWSIGITMLIHAAIILFTGSPQMLPEFKARFVNEVTAYVTELLLIGLMSGVTSAGTVVLEANRLSMVLQSVLFLIIMLSAWIPVACLVWGFHKYTPSMISTVASIIVTFGICRYIQYRQCRKDIEDINAKLTERKD